ncbi:hypothetical protein KY289_001119 [Solanum tuberosum]|nr:hypothetical protein KY289_001119 [Solanum tuberosum]
MYKLKLSLDSQKKLEIIEPKKKPYVDSKDVGNSQTQSMDRSVTPLLPYFMDPTVCYVSNGYDGSGSEREDYLRYVNPNGVEMPCKGINWSYVCEACIPELILTNASFGRGAFPRGVASGYQDPRFRFDGVRSPIPWLDGSMFTDGKPRPVAGNYITPSFSNGDVVPSLKNQNVHPNIMK